MILSPHLAFLGGLWGWESWDRVSANSPDYPCNSLSRLVSHGDPPASASCMLELSCVLLCLSPLALLLLLLLFETGFLCVNLTVLELALWSRLASESHSVSHMLVLKAWTTTACWKRSICVWASYMGPEVDNRWPLPFSDFSYLGHMVFHWTWSSLLGEADGQQAPESLLSVLSLSPSTGGTDLYCCALLLHVCWASELSFSCLCTHS